MGLHFKEFILRIDVKPNLRTVLEVRGDGAISRNPEGLQDF